MENALLIGLSRQVALGRELDIVANNVANVATNGFKARQMRFREHLMPQASAEAFPPRDRRLSYVIDQGAPLDLSAGVAERTGRALDAAIKGDALFAVQTPAGERYTRNGAFEVNQEGQLATSDGHVVLGDNGPIAFSPQETGFALAPDGTVSTDQGPRGRLRLVRFASPQALRNEGANLFSATAQPEPAGPTSRLEPGSIERSNVKPVLEMGRLIEVNRSYASTSAMMSRLDELRRSAISRLADAAA